VRPPPRAGVAPYISDGLDPMSLQEGDKVIEAAGRMSDGPDIRPLGRRRNLTAPGRGATMLPQPRPGPAPE
jgi:hypothetical protein